MPGLLDASAVAKLLASMTGGANLPQQENNPTYGPMNGAMPAPQGGLLQPTPDFNPNARQTSPMDDPTHEHRKGVKGGILHAVGADRVAPELANLLTEDQQKRVQPGLLSSVANFALRGRTPAQVQMERAATMLGLQDKKKARDLTARQERQWEQVQGVATNIADPQARLEYVARMASALGLPQGEETATAADRMRPPQMQARANAKMTVLGDDGNYYAIQQDAMGNEVPNSRVRVPKPTSGITYKEGVGPDGKPVIYALPAEESGDTKGPVKPRETGVEVPVPNKDDPQTIKVINTERGLAYDDAERSILELRGDDGKIKDPPGNFDRFATRTEWLNWAATRDGQAYMNNVRKLIRSWVVLVEGKRMSDADARVNELQRSFSVGDKSLVVEGKKQTLESMAESIKKIGRPGADGAVPAKGKTITVNGKTFVIPEN